MVESPPLSTTPKYRGKFAVYAIHNGAEYTALLGRWQLRSSVANSQLIFQTVRKNIWPHRNNCKTDFLLFRSKFVHW
jgi:hypothetical protein